MANLSMMHSTFQHFFIGIFAVANNLSALGVFLSICNGLSRSEQLRLCKIASITAFIVMMVAMLSGGALLSFFGITIEAFRIAGGFLLCVSGMNMLNSKATSMSDTDKTTKKSISKVISVAIIPVAIPLTTGAGTFSTIIIFADQSAHNYKYLLWLFLAIVTCTGCIYLIFKYSMKLFTVLGETGMNVLIKVMGLITLAIGVQFIIYGLAVAFPRLG